MRRRPTVLLCAGMAGVVGMAAVSRGALGGATAQTWPPFALVAGLLLVGAVAGADGVFAAAAALLDRLPGGDWVLYAVAMLLVGVVTALLNLDTSAAFLTPVLIHAARRRGTGERRLLYGCVFMSNSASLLLPGSNLTNLLVLGGGPARGSSFAARMALPWLAGVVVTAAVVAVLCRDRRQPAQRHDTTPDTPHIRGVAGLGGVVGAGALTLTLSEPALPVLALGLLLVAVRLRQERVLPAQLARVVDAGTLAGVFLVALTLGAVARVWSFPATLMHGAGVLASAILGAGSAVVVNNLPAAVLLGSHQPAHARALLIGLNIGPNLAMTGSLSALIWWQAARSVGARPSALAYSRAGVVLVPLAMAAALAATR